MPSIETQSRKQREIQQREELILKTARDMVLERGYLGLTMDRVATAIAYSKGTIYQHFSCKEDLLAALLLKSCLLRAEFFDTAATFRGRSRQRMTAIGVADELLVRLYPHHIAIETVLKTTSIREKASGPRIDAITQSEQQVLGVVCGIARDAIAQGDLTLPDGERLEDRILGLWGLHLGTNQIAQLGMPLQDLGFSDPRVALRRNAQVFLDGLGWQPLSDSFDADAARQEILATVFAEPARAAGLL